MHCSKWVATAVALMASSVQAGTFYDTEAAFNGAIQPNPYIEDFTNFHSGTPVNSSQTTWAAPGGNGFGWTASANRGLYSNESAISTADNDKPITITFTGAAVTAFGGNFTNTNLQGFNIPGAVTVTTSDGGTQSITSPDEFNFLGYTSTTPITSITITTSGAVENFVQVDHFYTGVTGSGNEPWRAADINSDNKVSVGDLGILATHFGQSTTNGKSFGDLNADGAVTVGDLGILATYFGQPTAATGSTTLTFNEAMSKFPELQGAAVPEPTAAILLLTLAPVAVIRRQNG